MEKLDKFLELINILKTLRAPGGCDWDREQTHSSLIPYLTEETYEVIEAIENNDTDSLKEELGDLLLHVLFQAELSSEKKQFDIFDSIDAINKKLIHRHPHIFDKNNNSAKQNWELSKKKSKNRESVLDGIPKNLPSLVTSERLQDKSAQVGFEWDKYQDVIDKIYEELEELKLGIQKQDQNNIEEEIGDLLIGIVNLSRFLNVSAEVAMQKSNTARLHWHRDEQSNQQSESHDHDLRRRSAVRSLPSLAKDLKDG